MTTPETVAAPRNTEEQLVRCDRCQHYRHTPSTLRTVCVGMFSDTFGHGERHECMLDPRPVSVTPAHKCGGHTPNNAVRREMPAADKEG